MSNGERFILVRDEQRAKVEPQLPANQQDRPKAAETARFIRLMMSFAAPGVLF